MKKILGLSVAIMLGINLVGCASTSESDTGSIYKDDIYKEDIYKDGVDKEEPKEEVKEEEPEETEKNIEENVKDVNPEDVESAYEYLKPSIEKIGEGLTYDYEILEGDIYFVGYISEEEFNYAVQTKLWEKNLEELSNATEIISKELRKAGYTKVKFNFAYCDLEKGQEKTYAVARNGRIVYDRLEENK